MSTAPILGEEGLDLGKLYDYDIILLDLNLPDMHGYDVLKKLRVAKVQTPVLILSGISEMDSRFAASALALMIMSPSPSTAKNWSPAFMRLCAVRRAIRNRSSAPASCRQP
jgi:DNA-binding NarL/FixJ family response regulator